MNDDRSEFARVNTNDLDWAASPSQGVWRKRCFLDGDKEKGAVTSVVRYDEGSRFPTHQHPEGEELLVLDGVFTDASGSYPAGTFILNPPGSEHAPASTQGCQLFVRLRQYDGPDAVRIDWTEGDGWIELRTGVDALPLWSDDKVAYRMIRLASQTQMEAVSIPHGEEIFVVSGQLTDDRGAHPAGTWLRYPAGVSHTPETDGGCLFLVRKLLRAP